VVVRKIRRAAAVLITSHLVIRMMTASHPRNQKIINNMIAMEVAKEKRRAVQKRDNNHKL
jgi:hypothetical protein